MKRVISYTVSLLLSLSLLLGLCQPALAASGDEVRAAKKIISVVYDDSGSMGGERWVYTSYAMQALIALLNEQDELYITYMSRPGSSTAVNLGDLTQAVEEVRSWDHSDGTPGEAVYTARRILDEIQETDATTQFWLVILTDGEIFDLTMSLQQQLDGYKGTIMSNGSSLNVAYLGMGVGAQTVIADKSAGLYTYSTDSSSEIFQTMSQLANLISGRLTADDVQQVDDCTITFSSNLPLYSISVLSQQSAAAVLSAETDEIELNIDRNIALSATDPFDITRLALYGNATVINRTDSAGVSQVIPKGTYTVTFDQPVELEDLLVQYEPAIGMQIEVTRGGVAVNDLSTLSAEDTVDIAIVPVVPGTDQKIADSDLPKNASWTIEYEVDGTLVDSGSGTTLTGVTLQAGNGIIRGTLQIPGYAPLIQELSFTVAAQIRYENLSIITDQPDPLTYLRNHLGGDSQEGTCVTFQIANDGIPLTKEELKAAKIKLTVDEITCEDSSVTGFFHRLGKQLVKCSLEQQDDGSYQLVPKEHIAFTSFLLKAGLYQVQVSLSTDNTVTAQGHFTIIPQIQDWINLIILLGIFLLILYFIFILFIKYHFTGQTVYYEVFRLNRSDGTGTPCPGEASSQVLSRFGGHLLLPVRSCFLTFNGLKLIAGPDGGVYISGDSIAKQVSGYAHSATNPVNGLSNIVASMHRTERKNGRREAADQSLSRRPIYFQSVEGDRSIWRIYLEE